MFNTKKRHLNAIIHSLIFFGKLLEQGLSPSKALDTLMLAMQHLAFEKKNADLLKIWHEIYKRLSAGTTFRDTIEVVLYNMVDDSLKEKISTAEQNGTLPVVLSQLESIAVDSPPVENDVKFDIQECATVQIVDKMLLDAFHKKTTEIAINYMPESNNKNASESIEKPSSELDDQLSLLLYGSEPPPPSVPIFLKNEHNNWEHYIDLPYIYRFAILNRICFISQIPFWIQAKSMGSFTLNMEHGEVQYEVCYLPEEQQMFIRMRMPNANAGRATTIF